VRIFKGPPGRQWLIGYFLDVIQDPKDESIFLPAGAARFGLPSAVRGMLGVGWLSHCAVVGTLTIAKIAATSEPVRLLIVASKVGHLAGYMVL
jgi:hypothetical protein